MSKLSKLYDILKDPINYNSFKYSGNYEVSSRDKTKTANVTPWAKRGSWYFDQKYLDNQITPWAPRYTTYMPMFGLGGTETDSKASIIGSFQQKLKEAHETYVQFGKLRFRASGEKLVIKAPIDSVVRAAIASHMLKVDSQYRFGFPYKREASKHLGIAALFGRDTYLQTSGPADGYVRTIVLPNPVYPGQKWGLYIDLRPTSYWTIEYKKLPPSTIIGEISSQIGSLMSVVLVPVASKVSNAYSWLAGKVCAAARAPIIQLGKEAAAGSGEFHAEAAAKATSIVNQMCDSSSAGPTAIPSSGLPVLLIAIAAAAAWTVL